MLNLVLQALGGWFAFGLHDFLGSKTGLSDRQNVAGVDYHQYLGLFDALGQLNAWGIGPSWPPTWHPK